MGIRVPSGRPYRHLGYATIVNFVLHRIETKPEKKIDFFPDDCR